MACLPAHSHSVAGWHGIWAIVEKLSLALAQLCCLRENVRVKRRRRLVCHLVQCGCSAAAAAAAVVAELTKSTPKHEVCRAFVGAYNARMAQTVY